MNKKEYLTKKIEKMNNTEIKGTLLRELQTDNEDDLYDKPHYQICPNCKKEFITLIKTKKYCSPECKNRFKRRKSYHKNNPKKEYTKTCINCGKSFYTTSNIR